MNAGMNEENFRQLAATMARLDGTVDQEPVALVRCENGWRTLYADGSSHPGRPVSQHVMEELGVMVDQHRADQEELRRLANLWDAIEAEFSDDLQREDLRMAQRQEKKDAVAAENLSAAYASEQIIDVEALEDSLSGDDGWDWVSLVTEGVGESQREEAAPTRLELGELHTADEQWVSDGQPGMPDASATPVGPPPGHPEAQWRDTSTFVPWSVVEAMVDVELDQFFRRRDRRAS